MTWKIFLRRLKRRLKSVEERLKSSKKRPIFFWKDFLTFTHRTSSGDRGRLVGQQSWKTAADLPARSPLPTARGRALSPRWGKEVFVSEFDDDTGASTLPTIRRLL